jgi:hypothetical protein
MSSQDNLFLPQEFYPKQKSGEQNSQESEGQKKKSFLRQIVQDIQDKEKIDNENVIQNYMISKESAFHKQQILKTFTYYLEKCARQGKSDVGMCANLVITLDDEKQFYFKDSDIEELDDDFRELGVNVSFTKSKPRIYYFSW